MIRGVVLAALLACTALPAAAQTPSPSSRSKPPAAAAPSPPAAPGSAPATAAPGDNSSAAKAGSTPGPWVVSCAEPQEGKPRDCRLMATAVAQPQNQRLLTAALLRQPETRSLVLVFQVAHGTALSAGLTWQVDEGEVQRLVFQNSDAQGVYAGMPVADDLLAALRRGKQLRVNFALTGRREVVAVTLPLTSFSEASTEFFATEQKSTP